MKDPAFLFYYRDFAHGTRQMTFFEKGAYIELLCEQADTGHLTIEQIKRTLKSDFEVWESIKHKFETDEQGKFFNSVLEKHINDRRKFTESRRKNVSKRYNNSTSVEHMKNTCTTSVPTHDLHMANANAIANADADLNNPDSSRCLNKEEEEKNLAFADGLIKKYFSRIPNDGDFEIMNDLISKHGEEKVHEAFKIARSQDINKLAYVKGVLENEKPRNDFRGKNGNTGSKSKHSAESLHQRWADWLERNPQHKDQGHTETLQA